MITVGPDPAHPRGGYAVLSLPEGDVAGDATEVAVFDNYSERYLGEAGWQATKALFGPYKVERSGGMAQIVIGPEIVNQIEEYANVRVSVGAASGDVGWPDDVVPAPGAAKIGGIMTATAPAAAAAEGAATPDPPPAPTPTAEPLPDTAPPVDPIPVKSGWGSFAVGALVVVLGSAALAYWFLFMQEDPPVSPAVSPEPVVSTTSDPCSAAELGAIEGFAAQADALRACGANTDADTALGLVERAAASGNGDALLLFGVVYDGAVVDPVIEDQIGLTFEDNPATAAEYYARAVAGGSLNAADNLAALCTRMADMTDTLVQGAINDYCDN